MRKKVSSCRGVEIPFQATCICLRTPWIYVTGIYVYLACRDVTFTFALWGSAALKSKSPTRVCLTMAMCQLHS